MLKAADEEGVQLGRKMAETIFSSGMIPVDWEENFILNLYKGKGEAIDRGNNRSLKLADQIMKLLERVLDSSIHQMVNINETQFAFVPGRGTTDAIFLVCQLQKYIAPANKKLYFAFIELERAFDRVSSQVLWWALGTLGVNDWAVHVIQDMYHNAQSRVWVNGQYNEEFGVGVGLHQGSVLSPVLFILVLEALLCKLCTTQHNCAMGVSLC